MKKIILSLSILLVLCGSIYAQHTSHWADLFDSDTNNPYDMQEPLVAFIKIDDNFVTATDNWADLEVCYFVGEECRGHEFMANYTDEEEDPYPILEAAVFFNTDLVGETVTFKLYDHAAGLVYGNGTSNIAILTGEYHDELYFDYDNAVILSFTTPNPATYTKRINGYTEGENDHYYLIASPIGEVMPGNVLNMLENTYDLYSFDQTKEKEWLNYGGDESTGNPGGFSLVSGKGYLYANSDTIDLKFTGTPVEGTTFEVTLVKDDGANLPGHNLVGNPFAKTAYIGGRDFYVMNADGTEIITATKSAISPMEGVFVIANQDEEIMTFTTAPQAPQKGGVILNLSKGRGVIDRAIVRFGDVRNLPKFQLNPNNTKVYIPMDNQDYAVVGGENIGELPVNFVAAENGTYTLGFAAENTQLNYLHLIDNKTGNDVDLLATQNYSFEAKTGDYANRFRLVFAQGNGNDDNFAFISNGEIIINGEGMIQIFDVLGRTIVTKKLSSPNSHFSTITFKSSVYMLRLVNGDNVKTQKIVVR